MRNLAITLCATAMLSATSAFADGHLEHLNSGMVLPEGNLPFSEVVVAGDTLYLSGMIGLKPKTFKMVEGGIEAESRQTMENIKTMLEANGYSLANLAKCTVYMADISEWGTFNKVYSEFFEPGEFPARAALGGTDLALGAKVEVDCIGVK